MDEYALDLGVLILQIGLRYFVFRVHIRFMIMPYLKHVCFASVDWEGVRNLVLSLPSSLERIVLVSSIGVTKFNELPWRCGMLPFVLACTVGCLQYLPMPW